MLNETHTIRFKSTGKPINVRATDIGTRVFVGNINGYRGLFVKVRDYIINLYCPAHTWPVEGTTINSYQETVKVEEGV